jgi:hypothetical protein
VAKASPQKAFAFITTRILRAEEPVVRRKSLRRRRSSCRRLGGGTDVREDISHMLQKSMDSFSIDSFSMSFSARTRDNTGISPSDSNGSTSASATLGSGKVTSGYILPPKSMELSSSTPSALDGPTSTNEPEDENHNDEEKKMYQHQDEACFDLEEASPSKHFGGKPHCRVYYGKPDRARLFKLGGDIS